MCSDMILILGAGEDNKDGNLFRPTPRFAWTWGTRPDHLSSHNWTCWERGHPAWGANCDLIKLEATLLWIVKIPGSGDGTSSIVEGIGSSGLRGDGGPGFF